VKRVYLYSVMSGDTI